VLVWFVLDKMASICMSAFTIHKLLLTTNMINISSSPQITYDHRVVASTVPVSTGYLHLIVASQWCKYGFLVFDEYCSVLPL